MQECIVIIDPQKDFISLESSYAKRHSGITRILAVKGRLNRLLNLDLGPKFVIITSDYEKDQFEKDLFICIPGTEGHQIDLDINDSHMVISKTQHSCFSSPAFLSFLKMNNIGHLVLCGFLSEYCVKQTAIDALDSGYKVTIWEDCIGTADDVQERQEQMLLTLKEKGAEVRDSAIIPLL